MPGQKLNIQGHCTEITGDLGIEWLKTRPKDKPFFLMLHQKAPHRPWDPDEKNKALFKDKVIPEPDTLRDAYATRPTALPANEQTVAKDLTRRDLKLEPPADLAGPKLNQWLNFKPMELEVTQPDGTKKTLTGDDLVKWKYQRYMQDYLACVQGVDDGIGRVLDYLEKTGLARNTVVFYTSDNGFFLGDNGMFDKRFMYEESLRMPFLVRYPGHIKAGKTGVLASKHLSVDEREVFNPTDVERLDGYPDHVSCSIEYPNGHERPLVRVDPSERDRWSGSSRSRRAGRLRQACAGRPGRLNRALALRYESRRSRR